MTVFTLVSVKGSPGVTTAAAAMAAAARRGRPSGAAGRARPVGRRRAAAVAAARRPSPTWSTRRPSCATPEARTTRSDAEAVEVLPGLPALLAPGRGGRGRGVVSSIGDGWGPAFRAYDGLVMVDAGRWDPGQASARRIEGADVVGLVCRATAVSVEHARHTRRGAAAGVPGAGRRGGGGRAAPPGRGGGRGARPAAAGRHRLGPPGRGLAVGEGRHPRRRAVVAGPLGDPGARRDGVHVAARHTARPGPGGPAASPPPPPGRVGAPGPPGRRSARERAQRANHEHSAVLGPEGRSVSARIPKGAPMSERSERTMSTVRTRPGGPIGQCAHPEGCADESDHHELVSSMRRQVALLIGDEVDRREREGLDPLDDVDRRMMADAEIRRILTEHWRTTSQRGEPRLSRDDELHIAEAVRGPCSPRCPAWTSTWPGPDVTDIFINGCDDVRLRTMTARRSGGAARVERRRAGGDDPGPGPPGRAARRRASHGADRAWAGSTGEGVQRRRTRCSTCSAVGRVPAGGGGVGDRTGPTCRSAGIRWSTCDQKDLVARGMYDEGDGEPAGGGGAGPEEHHDRRRPGPREDHAACGRCSTSATPASGSWCSSRSRSCSSTPTPVRHNHVLSWVARPANMEGEGEVTLADLAWAIKRHNPDRIVVGEVLGRRGDGHARGGGQGIAGAMCTHALQGRLPRVRPHGALRPAGPRRPRPAVRAGHRGRLALDLVVLPGRHRPAGRRRAGRDHPRRRASTPDRTAWSPASGSSPGPTAPRSRNHHAPIPAGCWASWWPTATTRPCIRPGGDVVSTVAALAGLLVAVGLALVVSGARPAPVAGRPHRGPQAPGRAGGQPGRRGRRSPGWSCWW